jgi:hypothetical protein
MSLIAAGSALITFVILFFYPEHYGRLTVDTSKSVTEDKVMTEETYEVNSKGQSLLLNTSQPINTTIVRL